jgi:hypothetical protein
MRKRKKNILNDKWKDHIHELWLIYCQLKDAETDLLAREQLISSARGRLGLVLNALHPAQLSQNRRVD